MTDPDERKRLAALDDRIRALKARHAPRPEADGPVAGADIGWRMVIELVTGLLIGLGIGWELDSLFGTLPIFLVLFMGFGFAAGVRVMLRSAREIEQRQAGGDASGRTDERDEERGS